MIKPTPTAGVPIDIFGKAHTLRFKALGIIDIERKTGKSFMRQAKEIFEAISIELASDLIAAGLKHELPEVTALEVAAEIDLEQLEYFTNCITEAFAKAFPKKPEAVKAIKENGEKLRQVDREVVLAG